MDAEARIFASSPLQWLKSGPGKERTDAAGWTTSPKPLPPSQPATNLLLNPQFAVILGAILGELATFPEAKARVGQALAAIDMSRPAPKQVVSTGVPAGADGQEPPAR